MAAPTGCVFLVGAGPGDPGLLTLRGRTLLEQADVVVYDNLSHPALLKYCPQAESIYAGKKASAHSMTQEQINQLLIDRAKAGACVVRLKGGDPFVFARGGEECSELANAGVDFEVVPGITAALAAPAYAGIPVTHRDCNSSFTFVTGHEKEQAYQDDEAKQRTSGAATDLDWSALARMGALAFYMGVKALPRICRRLIENGMDPQTPAAVIHAGTLPTQQTVVGTLADLPEKAKAANIKPPAMTIVGSVVNLRETINWYERRPLFGRTIVVTRTRQQASALTQQLQALGANVIESPTITVAEPLDWSPIDTALRAASNYDWIIFTSVNGVEMARKRIFDIGLDARFAGNAKIAAIGSVTEQAVRKQLSLQVTMVPEKFMAEDLAEKLVEIGAVQGQRFLLLRADIARPALSNALTEAGAAEVNDVPIYRTLPADELPQELIDAINEERVDWLTFASSGTVKSFLRLAASVSGQLGKIKIASIGPITSSTLRAMGLPQTIEAEPYTIEALAEAMLAYELQQENTE